MRRSKYGNVRINGFDSKAEYARYVELKILEKAGLIDNLKRQVRFPLAIGPHLIATYVADFTYNDTKTGFGIVEDVKGVKTATYQMKKKLMFALWGIKIKETLAKDMKIGRAR